MKQNIMIILGSAQEHVGRNGQKPATLCGWSLARGYSCHVRDPHGGAQCSDA